MRAWSTFAFLILLSLTVAPASADLVNYGYDVSLPGGTVSALVFAGSGTDVGCAYWDGSTTVLGGPNCPGPVTLGQTNLASGATTTFGAAGVTNTRSLAILFVPAEPSGGPQRSIQVDYLVLALQDPGTGDAFFYATLPSPHLIDDGSAGYAFIYSFDWDQAAAAQNAITAEGLTFSSVRLSLGAELSLVNAGKGHSHDFYFANINDIVPVPEPATLVLIGAGLLGLGLLRRRK